MPRITVFARRVRRLVVFASMRPGRYAPDNDPGAGRYGLVSDASMRPGRYAPDNSASRHVGCRTTAWGFNEAGALCPG